MSYSMIIATCSTQVLSRAIGMVANATNSEFLQEATNLVQSGSALELRTKSKRAE
jgi:hypothetical protein